MTPSTRSPAGRWAVACRRAPRPRDRPKGRGESIRRRAPAGCRVCRSKPSGRLPGQPAGFPESAAPPSGGAASAPPWRGVPRLGHTADLQVSEHQGAARHSWTPERVLERSDRPGRPPLLLHPDCSSIVLVSDLQALFPVTPPAYPAHRPAPEPSAIGRMIRPFLSSSAPDSARRLASSQWSTGTAAACASLLPPGWSGHGGLASVCWRSAFRRGISTSGLTGSAHGVASTVTPGNRFSFRLARR